MPFAMRLWAHLTRPLRRYFTFVADQRAGRICGGCGRGLPDDTFYCDDRCRSRAEREAEWSDAIK